jgi:membrane protease YdiL (CAAX protease family)
MVSQERIQTPSAVRAVQPAAARSLPFSVFWVYVLVFFAVWSLRALVLIRFDESIQSPLWKNLFSNSVKFLIWVVPAFVTLAASRLRPLSYFKLNSPIDKRGLLVSTFVVAVWLSLVVIGESVISGKSMGVLLSQRSSDSLTILAGAAISPIWEEILFRGFFLNRLNESFSFRISNVISALLFAAVHMPYWVSRSGFSAPVIKNSMNVFLLGCLFGWVMKKTNSLWPAIGAHIANNFLSGLIHS